MTPRATAAVAVATALVVAATVGWALTTSVPNAAMLRLALPAGRVVLDVCGVAAVGLAVLGRLVAGGQRRDTDGVLAVAARAGLVLAGLWAATAVILLWLHTADVAGLAPTDVGTSAVADYVDAFGAGTALVVTALCAITYGALTLTRGTGSRGTPARDTAPRGTGARGAVSPGLLVVVAVLGLLPGPLTGHASTAQAHELAVISVAVHAAAAALWVGGLGALLTLVATRRTLLATALPRFSPIAAAALAAVALSGVTTAAARLGSVSALVDTGYGRVILAKTVALAALAVLGALTRRRVLPAIRAHRRAPLAALAGSELLVMAVALGLAAALTRAPSAL